YNSMELFDKAIKDIRVYMQGKSDEGRVCEIQHTSINAGWPSGGGRNIVLSEDVGVELGNPREESVSFVVWTESPKEVKDGIISLIGPDLQISKGKSLPFGKVVIAGGKGFNEENSYDRYREMESIRYDVDLKGYMLRAVSQYQREWSRVSKEALREGFSLNVLGGALIDKFKENDYIDAVEVIFVTSSREDVKELKDIAKGVGRVVGAMNKMIEETSFDCKTCEYKDVCSEFTDLRKIRKVALRNLKLDIKIRGKNG
ncbi:MAG: hypothetical protein J7L53_04605, partial [Deltaproteobacteria bacterium]|nr:hypothetical protein [Deltaproteobacteria bacterium]